MKVIAFLCLLFLSNACEKGIYIPAYDADAGLDQQLNSIYKNGKLPGFAVAILDQEGVLFEKTIGYADLAQKRPFTNATQQNIASLTKPFVGIALMKVVSEGDISLDTPINDLLPFAVHHPDYPNFPITLRHLASHTSGMDDHKIEYKSVFLKENLTLGKKDISKENYQYFEAWSRNEFVSLDEFLRTIFLPDGVNHNSLKFTKNKPGKQYKYSNVGTSLLAYALGRVVGKPIHQYIREEILYPLSMKSTQWSFEEKSELEQTTTYFQSQLIVPEYQSLLYPSGGLHSTLADLNLFLIELLKLNQGNGHLLPTEHFQEMIAPQLTTEPSSKNQALLWELNDQQVGHNGGNYGVTLFMAFDKEKNYARIFMTNISSYEDRKLLPQMVEIWKLLEKEGNRLVK